MADDRTPPSDSTEPMPRYDSGDDPGGTASMPRAGQDDDATRIRPRDDLSDATRTMPAVDADDADGAPAEPRWSASAPVPPPGAVPVREYEYLEEPLPAPEDGRNWLTPLLVGFVGLILLGALLTGLWLIFAADDEPPPAPAASAPPASSAAPATTARTTAPATSAPPTTEAPEIVAVPIDLVGLSEDEARQRITDAGLRVQVTRRADATMAPGTVLEVEPAPGTEVEPNSVVRIVVAVAPRPSAPGSSGSG